MKEVFMRLLLTGAAGYAGRGIAEILKNDGFFVRGCDIKGEMSHVDEACYANIADLEEAQKMAESMDALVLCHMAPNPSGYVTPPLAIDVNIKGTANLYHAAIEKKVKRIILISSTSVMNAENRANDPGNGPYAYTGKEKMNFYGLTKSFQEGLARWYWETHGLPSALLRPCWVVYDGSHTTKYGNQVERYNTGLIDPRDIGTAVIKALQLSDLQLEAFNIGLKSAWFDVSSAFGRLGWEPKHLFLTLPGAPNS